MFFSEPYGSFHFLFKSFQTLNPKPYGSFHFLLPFLPNPEPYTLAAAGRHPRQPKYGQLCWSGLESHRKQS